MVLLPAIYLSAALYYFTHWWKAFQQDTDLSDEESRFSWFVIVVATLLWPIVVPISEIEKSIRPCCEAK
jgi:hypothetical protein